MNRTILLVEDSEDDVFLFTRALRTSGVAASVNVAINGREALEYLNRAQVGNDPDRPIPNLVLLDLKLPHLLGLEVLKWIRSQSALQTLVVVILTSSSQGSDLVNAWRLGANSYLVKPSTFDELVVLVRCMAEYWLVHNRRP